MYALLPNKRQETYDGLFELIKPISHFSIQRRSLATLRWQGMNSVQKAFPRAELHGCLFHLTKSMRRQLSENGILQRYGA